MLKNLNSVSIVIPALNEEEAVGRTVKSIKIDDFRKAGLEVEVIVVDNDSEDNTAAVAREAGAKVITEKRRGYGSAYLRGLREAKGDIIVIGDADGTYPLDRSLEFIQPILRGEADFVMGSRLNGHIQDGAMPWLHRRIGNPLLSFALNFFFKTRISDAQCGMRAFTKEALRKMRLKTTGMEFGHEMIYEAVRNNLRIAEVPIEYRPRKGGEPKLKSFRDGWRYLRFLLMYSPNYLFILPGILAFTAGMALMLLLLKGPITLNGVSLFIHPMIVGSLLTLLGFQLLITGITTKNFAIGEGFTSEDSLYRFVIRHLSLERSILAGGLMMLAGFLLNLYVVYLWYLNDYGRLSSATLKIAIFGATLIVIGFQVIFSAFFISITNIERLSHENIRDK